MRTNVDKLRKVTEKMAQKAGISEEEFQKRIESAKEEMKQRKIPSEMEERYVLKRVQMSLKAKASGAQEFEGFFIAKTNAFDYAKKGRETMDEFVRDEGQRLAKQFGLCDANLSPTAFVVDTKTKSPITSYSSEEEEQGLIERMPPMTTMQLSEQIKSLGMQEAVKKGLANDKGEYLYQKPDFKKGKPMPAHDFSANLIGFFTAPGDDEPKLTSVVVKGELATQEVPLFEVVKFQGRINKDKTTASSYSCSMNKPVQRMGTAIDFWDYEENIRKALGGNMLESLQDLDNFIQNNSGFGIYCAVVADILEVGASGDYDSVVTRITDETMNSIQSNESEYTFWTRQELARGLDDMISDAFIVLAPYKKQDGSISGNVIGYWIDPLLRPMTSGLGEIEPEEVEEPWGYEEK
jgi:hypothetical protein